MKPSEIVYTSKGNIEQLCNNLRTAGFGVSHCWDDRGANDFYKVKDISLSQCTLSSRINDNGKITDSKIIGQIEMEKSESDLSAEFELSIFLESPGSNKLKSFADLYDPTIRKS